MSFINSLTGAAGASTADEANDEFAPPQPALHSESDKLETGVKPQDAKEIEEEEDSNESGDDSTSQNDPYLTREERNEVRELKHEMKEELKHHRPDSPEPSPTSAITAEMERLEEIFEEHEHTREAQILEDAMKEWEYPFERHFVQTASGWVLEMHRVKHGKGETTKSNPEEPRPVVMLQHGLFNSSSAWLVTGPKYSLALKLADAGYDVWLGNNRGTHFARKHKRFTMKDPQFWNWSFQHMGLEDLPSQINYVLKQTKQEKLTYIGHSQGTTQAFVGFSTLEELQDKVNLFIGLAPVTSLKHQRNHPLRVLAAFKTASLLKWVGMGEFGHRSVSTSILPGIASSFKNKLLSKLNGLWSVVMDCNLDSECLALLTQLEPSPTSLTNLAHWAYLVRSGRFCKRDLGRTRNERLYGEGNYVPEDYPLENIGIPVALFYGTLDLLSTPKDVEGYLIPKLKRIVYFEKCEHYKHNDFIWSKSAENMQEKILKLMRAYSLRDDDEVKTESEGSDQVEEAQMEVEEKVEEEHQQKEEQPTSELQNS